MYTCGDTRALRNLRPSSHPFLLMLTYCGVTLSIFRTCIVRSRQFLCNSYFGDTVQYTSVGKRKPRRGDSIYCQRRTRPVSILLQRRCDGHWDRYQSTNFSAVGIIMCVAPMGVR